MELILISFGIMLRSEMESFFDVVLPVFSNLTAGYQKLSHAQPSHRGAAVRRVKELRLNEAGRLG